MSTTALSLNPNSQATQPPKRRLTLQQETLLREFKTDYGIEPLQISFDDDTLNPNFDFDALNLLVHTLGNFPRIATELDRIEEVAGLVTAACEVTVKDGRTRRVTGGAVIGESLPDSVINDYQQALNVAQARSLRKALRAVGWDAYRAHQATKSDAVEFTPAPPTEVELRNNDLAQIHILGRETGLIGPKGDKSIYYRMLAVWFPELAEEGKVDQVSAEAMNEVQRAKLITMLRALKTSAAVSINTGTVSALRANAEAVTQS